MPLNVLQRDMWRGEPVKQANWLLLRKTIRGRERTAVGELWLVQLGWELRLLVDDEFQRSHVCRSQEEVFDTIAEWKAALTAKGWA